MLLWQLREIRSGPLGTTHSSCGASFFGGGPEVNTVGFLDSNEMIRLNHPAGIWIAYMILQILNSSAISNDVCKRHTHWPHPPIFKNSNSFSLLKTTLYEYQNPMLKTPKSTEVTEKTEPVKPQSGPDGKKGKVPLFIFFVFLFSFREISTKESVWKAQLKWHPIHETFQVFPAGNDLAIILWTTGLFYWIIIFGCIFSWSLDMSHLLS